MRQTRADTRLPAIVLGASTFAVLVCMAVPSSGVSRTVALIGTGAAVAALLAILLSIGWHGFRHLLLVRRLDAVSVPGVLAGLPVRELSGIGVPFVAGIRSPEIYCPPALSARLDESELRAVLLHEHHHVAARAPARLLLLSAVASLMPLDAVRRWFEAERATLEIEADAHAIERGSSRATLAAALLKLSNETAPVGTSGFANSSELRVRALVGEYEPPRGHRGLDPGATLATLAVAAACLVLYLS